MKQISLILFIILGNIIMAKAQQPVYSIEFNPENYTIQTFTFNEKSYTVRAFENIVYVANPVDTAYQKMNIYVPEEYFQGKKINNYTRESAPIFFPNGIGGYMPSAPLNLSGKSSRNIFGQRPGGRMRMPQPPAGMDMKQGSAIQYALANGYVVATAGARGRSLKNSQGVYTGKAPAGLVDLKAAICYLRYNNDKIPGNKERILSNGTSAGGAMSTLLGATGNHPDYKPYLQEIGAADMPDDIFAVSAYCPITDLDHADCAYEWQFNGINTYESFMMDMIEGEKPAGKNIQSLTEQQELTSAQLKTLFPIYLNSLNLKDPQGNLLTLDEQGMGSFRDFVISFVLASAQVEIDKGKDLSDISWLTVKNNKAVALDFEAYVKNMKRMKTPPAFDSFDLSAPENHLFGTAAINAQHFTEFSYKNSPDKGTLAAQEIINMMNPLHYLSAPQSKKAANWHIRYGSIDNNTSLAIEVILATSLVNKGYDVDFAIAWNRPHMGDYDLEELFRWMDEAAQ